uniref:Laminin subunit gamma-3 isoform X1 n=1 Tax=Pogona vitticeps TaxID=103695 RepID=A0ABM5F750_9SAUR
MAGLFGSLVWVFLEVLRLATGAMDSCYNAQGRAQRCLPIFENAAFGRQAQASNTCGSPPEDYCLQMGTRDSGALCHRCDARQASLHHNATYLTDFHHQEEPTWWQSQSMAFGVQYPHSVNITLHLGKSYEITYVRLKFHTSRPESFAIYKRSREDGPWIPYQYYSASCGKTYGKPDRQYLRPGEDERVAFCTDEFSDISPLNGGNVAFSTLEGRPSAYSFDQSPILQEWVTGTDLLISLDRLNTFGDDIFKDPKVLQSYYYAISDFSVGGRCKCNGHASECIPNEADQLVCLCQHNTTGVDCERCQPFYQDRPWARGTAESANECLPCNCSGRSDECFYDWELYRSTGHGGHCRNCRENTAGPHCERCRQNFYRWDAQVACQPCNCNPAGSLNPQCDSSGTCECKDTVTGWKCERCREGFHSLSEGGCRPCLCDPAGSVGACDANTGRCACKEEVEGSLCNRCRPGSFNLQPDNPAGCTRCFCYGHSTACTASSGYEIHPVLSNFSEGPEGWRAENPDGKQTQLHWSDGEISVEQSRQKRVDFVAPAKFLHDQRFSYGQLLSVVSLFEADTAISHSFPLRLVLEGDGLLVSAHHSDMRSTGNDTCCEHRTATFRLQEGEMQPALSAFQFQRLLSNLTGLRIRAESSHSWRRISLKEVRLVSARLGFSPPALWVEDCLCPQGYMGQFCQSCAPGFKREAPFGGPLTSCVPCSCNQHGDCDPDTGLCQCLHNTEGPSCERCVAGFYGSPFLGSFNDCKPCPCPAQGPCTTIPESGEVVCTHCPPRQRGRLCELCEDGFFGDPLGKNGPVRPCEPCECSGNVDPNAVGNCDAASGRCLRCLYNTAGERCEACQEGFYGNPLAASPTKKCTPCECNPRGSTHGPEVCDGFTGQCRCLPHVTGRDCGRCEDGYFDLQQGSGCKRCQCHAVGAQHNLCHPVTGQCVCRPGVEGASCDRCQSGFIGFSFQGCRACNCSQMGSVSAQCHENSTCVCKRGFVGYKCDQCEANYFYDVGSRECRECPLCYGLVKEEADKLKAQLTEAELWLQKPSCDRPREGYDYATRGEVPRGDNLHNQYLLKGAKLAFLEETAELEEMVREAQIRLSSARRLAGCDGREGTAKGCVLFSDIQSTLQSTHLNIQLTSEILGAMEFPPEISHPPTNWSRAALESRQLSRSLMKAADVVEDTARKALRTANASSHLLQGIVEEEALLEFRRQMEERYQKIQEAQEKLVSEMGGSTEEAEKTLASVHRTNVEMAKNLSWISTLELRPLVHRAEKLNQEVRELAPDVALRGQQGANGSFMVQAGLQGEIQQVQQLEQLWERAEDAHALAASAVSKREDVVSEAKALLTSLEGLKKLAARHGRGQSPTRRKMALVRDRTLAEAQRKVGQARGMLGDSASASAAAQKTAREADRVAKESAQVAQDVVRGAKEEKRRASQLKTRVALTVEKTSHQEQEAEELGKTLGGLGQVAVEMNALNQSLQDTQRSLEQDIATLNHLLSSLGDLKDTAPSEAVLSASRIQLENLQVHLTEPGVLGRKLSALQDEAKQQQLRIEAYEEDLEEIRRDKQNLEAILRSLPEGCSRRK